MHNKKGYYTVMDSCIVHHSVFVFDVINKRGFKPASMPPNSTFLNSIEEAWSKIKKHIKRNALNDNDILTTRIVAACQAVKDQLGI
jgi:hypothetical protein